VIGDILQPTHLLFILVVALLVLGPKRLPEVARSLGRGLRDFRSAISGEDRDHHEEALNEPAAEDPARPASAIAQAEPATAQPEPAQPVKEPAEHIT
jgi:sec-independent protein translocase protein TatA